MFLAELSQEEKEAFLELASLISTIDGNVSVYESTILSKYQKEMGLEEYQVKGQVLEDILKAFKTDRSKNIVLTEILQMIFADGVFHEKERESLYLIKSHFGFESSEFESYKDWIDKIKELSVTKK